MALAGDELPGAIARLDGCRTGEAKLTPGFNLHARYIIHTGAWRANVRACCALTDTPCSRPTLQCALQDCSRECAALVLSRMHASGQRGSLAHHCVLHRKLRQAGAAAFSFELRLLSLLTSLSAGLPARRGRPYRHPYDSPHDGALCGGL